MLGTSWVDFFRGLPAYLHGCLILTLSNRTEIVVQRFVRFDDDLVILRGRMSGTQDGGLVVAVPYSNLVNVAFNRRMTDDEVESVFGAAPILLNAAAPAPPSAGEQPLTGSPPAPDAITEVQPALPPTEPPAVPLQAPSAPALASKSVLLAKLRARLAEGPPGALK